MMFVAVLVLVGVQMQMLVRLTGFQCQVVLCVCVMTGDVGAGMVCEMETVMKLPRN